MARTELDVAREEIQALRNNFGILKELYTNAGLRALEAETKRDTAIAALREIEQAGPDNSARALQYIARDTLEKLGRAT